MNYVIYIDLERLLVNQDACLNNQNKSYTTNVSHQILSGYSITALRNHNKSTTVSYYKGEDCIQKLCID